MPYTVIIENKAQKEFLKLSPPHDNSIKKAIEKLENVPRPSGATLRMGFLLYVVVFMMSGWSSP